MKTLLRAFSLLFAFSLGCSSSSSGSSGSSTDGGGAGQDAPSTHDAQGILDASDAGASGDDGPTDAPTAPVCVSDAGDPAPGDFANVPTCAPGTCQLAGTLAGKTVSQTYPSSSWSFANGTSFDADFGTGGHVHLTLAVSVTNGGASTTVGTMLMPSEGPSPGSTVCFNDGSRMQFVANDAGSEVRFIARCIEGSCTTSPVAMGGEIDGCCAK